MRRSRFSRSFLATLASLFALALFCPSAVRAHDEDDYEDDDGWYDEGYGDAYYDDGGHGDWCTYDHCDHSVAIPRYDMLAPYGAWRYVPAFGAHLWFPWVDRSWRPYYYGHWVRTSFGLTWVSHEPWGDIPHHYGHWVFVEPFGWGWVPGWEYSPAWVTWGVADGYVGWAPCPPPGYRYPRIHRYRPSVHVTWYGHHDAWGYPDSGLDFSLWIFVGPRDLCGRPVYRHALTQPHMLSLWKSKSIEPVGPRLDVASVERVSGAKLRTVEVDRSKRVVGGRSIEVYSPRGQKEFVRSGSVVAKRSYVKPARAERVEKSAPPRPEGVRRNEAPSRSEKVRASESREAGRAKVADKSTAPTGSKQKSKAERGSPKTHEKSGR
jgi:hypothetical protein